MNAYVRTHIFLRLIQSISYLLYSVCDAVDAANKRWRKIKDSVHLEPNLMRAQSAIHKRYDMNNVTFKQTFIRTHCRYVRRMSQSEYPDQVVRHPSFTPNQVLAISTHAIDGMYGNIFSISLYTTLPPSAVPVHSAVRTSNAHGTFQRWNRRAEVLSTFVSRFRRGGSIHRRRTSKMKITRVYLRK